jgi:hypothetical protein
MSAPDSSYEIVRRQPGDDPELEELEAALAQARARVAASMHALGEEFSRRADWRSWVRDNPGWTCAGAVVVGFILGFAGDWPAPTFKRRF